MKVKAIEIHKNLKDKKVKWWVDLVTLEVEAVTADEAFEVAKELLDKVKPKINNVELVEPQYYYKEVRKVKGNKKKTKNYYFDKPKKHIRPVGAGRKKKDDKDNGYTTGGKPLYR